MLGLAQQHTATMKAQEKRRKGMALQLSCGVVERQVAGRRHQQMLKYYILGNIVLMRFKDTPGF
jgi:hypothetical protein